MTKSTGPTPPARPANKRPRRRRLRALDASCLETLRGEIVLPQGPLAVTQQFIRASAAGKLHTRSTCRQLRRANNREHVSLPLADATEHRRCSYCAYSQPTEVRDWQQRHHELAQALSRIRLVSAEAPFADSSVLAQNVVELGQLATSIRDRLAYLSPQGLASEEHAADLRAASAEVVARLTLLRAQLRPWITALDPEFRIRLRLDTALARASQGRRALEPRTRSEGAEILSVHHSYSPTRGQYPAAEQEALNLAIAHVRREGSLRGLREAIGAGLLRFAGDRPGDIRLVPQRTKLSPRRFTSPEGFDLAGFMQASWVLARDAAITRLSEAAATQLTELVEAVADSDELHAVAVDTWVRTRHDVAPVLARFEEAASGERASIYVVPALVATWLASTMDSSVADLGAPPADAQILMTACVLAHESDNYSTIDEIRSTYQLACDAFAA